MTGGFWPALSMGTHMLGACAALSVAVGVWGARGRYGAAGRALVLALLALALWSLAAAMGGEPGLAAWLMLGLRNLAWLWALWRLFASDGRHARLPAVRPVVITLALVSLLGPGALAMSALVRPEAVHVVSRMGALAHLNVLLAMLVSAGALVLVHNLYAGARGEARPMLRWPALALALVWGFDLNLYTVACLENGWPGQLAALHGVIDAAFAAMIALGAARGRPRQTRLRPSRTIAFQSLSLLLIGGYLVAMVVVAQWLAQAGGDRGRWLQFGFLIVATAAALICLPSRRLRGWLRVMLVKHLFEHRYDYRAEWLRFADTMGGRAEGDALPLHVRAIQALADITDSPAGLLLMAREGEGLELAGRWQWPMVEVAMPALCVEMARFFEAQDYILDLDAVRAGQAPVEAADLVPSWLLEESRAWALVPLRHFRRLVGVVVLARPLHGHRLDWEDFDLLRVAGPQLATYLAEHASQQALAEATRFEDFHRRIAFVMHDIKNLASQMGLLAHNAERHAENPAFRADMLVTLRNSADKLNALMARLSRYGTGGGDGLEPVDLGQVAQDVARSFEARYPVQVEAQGHCMAMADRHGLEQALLHLVQNAVEASVAPAPVRLVLSGDAPWCCISVIDTGEGMSAQFLRDRLFRPFDSAKPGGFGIGAYEARELVRSMKGQMEVRSREGEGTRFTIRLPGHDGQPGSEIDRKVA